MRKLIFILLTLVSINGFGQWTRPNVSYGYQQYRISLDSTMFYPTGCGSPSLRLNGGTNLKHSAFYFDSCAHRTWVYDPKRNAWDSLHMGASGSVDLSGYVTLHTRQTIDGDKLFSYSIDNTSSLGGFTLKTTGANSRYRLFPDSENGLIISQITDVDSTISSSSALSMIGQNMGVLNLGRQGSPGAGALGLITFSSGGGYGTGVSNAYLRFNSTAGSPTYAGELEYENRSFGIALRVLADATLEVRGATPLFLSGMSTGAGYVLTDVSGDGHYTSQPQKVMSANPPLRITSNVLSVDTSKAFSPALTTQARAKQLIDSLKGVWTISGVTLGGNLAALTNGFGISSGGTYTGATGRTFAVDTTIGNTGIATQGFVTRAVAGGGGSSLTAQKILDSLNSLPQIDFTKAITSNGNVNFTGSDYVIAGNGDVITLSAISEIDIISPIITITGSPTVSGTVSASKGFIEPALAGIDLSGGDYTPPNSGFFKVAVADPGHDFNMLDPTVYVGQIIKVFNADASHVISFGTNKPYDSGDNQQSTMPASTLWIMEAIDGKWQIIGVGL